MMFYIGQRVKRIDYSLNPNWGEWGGVYTVLHILEGVGGRQIGLRVIEGASYGTPDAYVPYFEEELKVEDFL
jgi:hypothetical protein